MQYEKTKNGFLLRGDLDEELVENLETLCQAENITAGFFHGLGGIKSAELGYYELEEKRYHFQDFNDLVEIISLNGNVAMKDGAPFVHMHGCFGKRDLSSVSGHVKKLVIGGTAEIFFTEIDTPLERIHDKETGLSLLSFPQKPL